MPAPDPDTQRQDARIEAELLERGLIKAPEQHEPDFRPLTDVFPDPRRLPDHDQFPDWDACRSQLEDPELAGILADPIAYRAHLAKGVDTARTYALLRAAGTLTEDTDHE